MENGNKGKSNPCTGAYARSGEDGKFEVVTSVGIDIGTTTTQCVISKLTVRNTAPGTLVPRMEITDKEVVYKSAIHFTPILENQLVDTESVFALIEGEFQAAGVKPEEIDTGAVIITGETAKKENARRISGELAGFAGDFVVATAGGKLESVIAGRGSGASDYSRKHYCTVANIDIGGGTANVGIYRNGKAIDSCCINVGGRLLGIDPGTRRVLHVTDPMKDVLEALSLPLQEGDAINETQVDRICRKMAEVVLESLMEPRAAPLADRLKMTDPLRLDYKIDAVMISGGVADHVYTENRAETLSEIAVYGDIGPRLGCAIRTVFERAGVKLVRPTETIRATVIGAGAQTVDVSGSTIQIADDLLPIKNIPVVVPFEDGFPLDARLISERIARAVDSYFEEDALDVVAVGISGNGYYSFSDIQILADGILSGMKKVTDAGLPLITVLEADSGKVLGQSLRVKGGNLPVLCVDQIELSEGDYIDIGKSIAGGTVVPVVIKTLVFETRQV